MSLAVHGLVGDALAVGAELHVGIDIGLAALFEDGHHFGLTLLTIGGYGDHLVSLWRDGLPDRTVFVGGLHAEGLHIDLVLGPRLVFEIDERLALFALGHGWISDRFAAGVFGGEAVLATGNGVAVGRFQFEALVPLVVFKVDARIGGVLVPALPVAFALDAVFVDGGHLAGRLKG